jgi:N-acetylmuramoyl-L-alanine amidase
MNTKRVVKIWQSIIIHHSYTKDTGTASWDAIREYHTDKLGWLDIGYHYGIEMINDEYEILVGRPIDMPGAHTKGRNRTSLGICCVGDYDHSTPPADMLSKLARHLAGLCHVLDISVGQIRAHREFANKSCPGNNFDMDHLRNLVHAHMER